MNRGRHRADDSAAVIANDNHFLFGAAFRAFHEFGGRFFRDDRALAAEIEESGSATFGSVGEGLEADEDGSGDGDDSDFSKFSFHIDPFLKLIRGGWGESLEKMLHFADRNLSCDNRGGVVRSVPTAIHSCPSCKTTATLVGHGKAKVESRTHSCGTVQAMACCAK